MRRIIGFICLALFMLGCDDGDFSVTTFNFPSLNLNRCSDNSFIYNVNQNEVLLLDIPLNNFVNIEGTRFYFLTPSDKLVFWLYTGAVNNSVLSLHVPLPT